MVPEPARLTLADLATMVGGRAVGDVDKEISGVASLEKAGPSDLGLLVDSGYSRPALDSPAGAILVSSELEATLDPTRSRIVVKNPRVALPVILERRGFDGTVRGH
jgi:UDP-3-O-[3-hydroxymyristoyl] glucosamine N-acyltransferase